MFVKKFEAPTLEQALTLVKKELGPDALVLSTDKKQGKWFRSQNVEVVAAFEKKQAEKEVNFAEEDLAQVFPYRKYRDAVAQPKKKPRVEQYIDIAESEAKPSQASTATNAAGILEKSFTVQGFSEESARQLALRVARQGSTTSGQGLATRKIQAIADGVRMMPIGQLVSRPIAVVGVAGCGKTTLLVKLALCLKADGRAVSLSSLDKRKVMAIGEMSAYAKFISVPFEQGRLSESKVGKCLLIDSPACSLDGVESWEPQLMEKSVVLVLDSTSRLEELLRIVEKTARFQPQAIAFTKTDLISQRGVIYDVLRTSKTPLLGVSSSQSFRVPFNFLEARALASFILRTGS
ncbi:MAG: hypothetical protein HY537_09345 [Deltaproteobacteria bacterium]|nr:hypothetical protein [Deltaproteobacteria bacterium]